MLSIARLEAASGNESASERALQQYASTHPWITPKYIDQQRAFGQLSAALARNDGRRVLAAADRLSSLTAPGLLFAKATGSLLSQDSASAERGFQRTIVENCLPQSGDFGATLPLVPLYSILTRYYLGQVYEATGKPQQAIDEYESFLSHFEGSQAALSQVEKARRSEEADAIVSDGLRPRLVVRRSNSQVLAVRSFPNLRCCSSSKSVRWESTVIGSRPAMDDLLDKFFLPTGVLARTGPWADTSARAPSTGTLGALVQHVRTESCCLTATL